MSDIRLVELKTFSDFYALFSVRVKPKQRRFTKNPIITFLQTRHHAVTTYAIHLDEQLIGFVMLIHAENPVQWIIERLTIASEHQRQGNGYAVADQLIEMIYNFENSEMVIARYAPENTAARKLFEKLNFVEREEMYRDRHVAVLEFEFEEDEKAKNADVEDEYNDVDEASDDELEIDDASEEPDEGENDEEKD